MLRRRKVWICLADGAHARIITRADESTEFNAPYSIVVEFDSRDAHHRSRDLGADRPGRTQESANAAHHAIAPRTDPHRASKAEFIRLVARYLDEAGLRDDYDALCLVAPAACLNTLSAALQPTTRKKVISTKAKDLMKVPLARLAPHLSQAAAVDRR
jgi:protein required for attachment to host cells